MTPALVASPDGGVITYGVASTVEDAPAVRVPAVVEGPAILLENVTTSPFVQTASATTTPGTCRVVTDYLGGDEYAVSAVFTSDLGAQKQMSATFSLSTNSDGPYLSTCDEVPVDRPAVQTLKHQVLGLGLLRGGDGKAGQQEVRDLRQFANFRNPDTIGVSCSTPNRFDTSVSRGVVRYTGPGGYTQTPVIEPAPPLDGVTIGFQRSSAEGNFIEGEKRTEVLACNVSDAAPFSFLF